MNRALQVVYLGRHGETAWTLSGQYTCELAGFGAVAEIDEDLVEWKYGDYEGRYSADETERTTASTPQSGRRPLKQH